MARIFMEASHFRTFHYTPARKTNTSASRAHRRAIFDAPPTHPPRERQKNRAHL